MIIKSKNFILRHVKMSDLKGYLKVHQDRDTQKGFMHAPKTLKEARKELKRRIAQNRLKKPSEETFAIVVNNKFAGFIDLHHLNIKYREHIGEIGYCTAKEFRGKGITTEAVKLVTNYAFKKYKLKRLEAWCRTFNKASIRILEKAGYKLEGVLRKHKWKNGKYLDDMVWAKIK